MPTLLQLKRQLLIEFIAVCDETRGSVSKQSIDITGAKRRLEVLEGIVERYCLVSHSIESESSSWGFVDKVVRLRLERQTTLSDYDDIKNLLKWFIHGPSVSLTGLSNTDEEQLKLELSPLEQSHISEKMAAKSPTLKDQLEKQLEDLEEMRKKVEDTLRDVSKGEDKDTEERPSPYLGQSTRLRTTLDKVASPGLPPGLPPDPPPGLQDQFDEEESQLQSKIEDLQNATRDATNQLADIRLQKSLNTSMLTSRMIERQSPITSSIDKTDKSRVHFSPSAHSSPYAQPILKSSPEEDRRRFSTQASYEGEYLTRSEVKESPYQDFRIKSDAQFPRSKVFAKVEDDLPPLYRQIASGNYDGDLSISGVNDPSRYLSKIPITTFSGDKKSFLSWWTAFEQCVDKSCLPDTIKLMRLRSCLSGVAAEAIDKLGHSDEAYEVAKRALVRKFGGTRRQLTILTDELHNFKPVRDNNAGDLEKLADLLDSLVVNLSKENPGELGTGYMYNGILRKLTPTLLTKYRRWMVDGQMNENVKNLGFFISQEAEFLTLALESIHGISSRSGVVKSESVNKKSKKNESARTLMNQSTEKKPDIPEKKKECPACGSEHGLWECTKYKKLSVPERWKIIKAKRLCLKCLGNHYYKKCWRKKKCSIQGCEMPHHETLHEDSEAKTFNSQSNSSNEDQPTLPSDQSNANREATTHHTGSQSSAHISFRTIPIVLSNGKKSIRVNALLDDASNKSYITNDVVAFLGLEGEARMLRIKAVNGSIQTVKSQIVTCSLDNDDKTFSRYFTAHSMPTISEGLKVKNLASSALKWPHLSGIKFPKPAGDTVDVLIGIDHLSFMKSLTDVGDGENGQPIARLTPLGWTCIGNMCPTDDEDDDLDVLRTHFTLTQNPSLNQTVQKFWELEEVETSKPFTKEENKAWDHAELTIQRTESGHYEVGIPWKEEPAPTYENYLMAVKRLASVERKLDKLDDEGKKLREKYQKVIDDYLAKGYIRKVPKSELKEEPDNHSWYLPHFPVIKEHVETTKLRIVFDGSAEVGGTCLNSYIITGPKLPRCLVDVLLQFRRNAIVVSCDIQEMYMRVLLLEKDRPYHRFLWRNSSDEEPEVYEFQRVVFGSNTSPFLAQFVAQHNAEKFQSQMPEAAHMILQGTYMDDSYGSVHTEDQGKKLIEEVKAIWSNAGMKAHKWLSNSSEVLETVPQDERISKIDLSKNELPKTKALGCGFDASTDEMTFDSDVADKPIPRTKREFLGLLATIFDPLGLLSPVIIRGKMLLQKCWITGCEWDEVLPEGLIQQIEDWILDLNALSDITVPRVLVPSADHKLSLHMLSDFSEDGYGAVVYSVAQKPGEEPFVNIVASKSKVAPLSTTSIPRLELQAAVLGAKLIKKVATTLNVDEEDCHAWVDSADVLYWVTAASRDHKTFVANRISLLHRLLDPSRWRHIAGKINTADLISRGATTRELLERNDWFQGPSFLKLPEADWPKSTVDVPTPEKRELKKNVVFTMHSITKDFPIMKLNGTRLDPVRWSDLGKLTRVLAYTLRAVGRMQKKAVDSGSLKMKELQEARDILIRSTQDQYYHEEIIALQHGKMVPRTSSILGLKPWIDQFGILRSNSRLSQGETLPWDLRYPVILPTLGATTRLIVQEVHERNHHVGVNATFSQLLQNFWLPRGREVVRAVLQSCCECKKRKVKPQQPEMAPLPSTRLDKNYIPFEVVSVDFAGPFYTIAGRGRTRYKRYMCLYTCLHTRAVHLEMVNSMTAQAFLMAFSRIVARRGKPKIVYSDNGSNFVGALSELEEFDATKFKEEIEKKMAQKYIDWRFQPPISPHFSGIHESLVKSAKQALLRILPTADISDEELSTAFCLTEQLLNDRPLTYQSMDECDLVALTPSHFLIGKKSIPIVDDDSIQDLNIGFDGGMSNI